MGSESQLGPWFQSDEDIKALVVVPLESKSAGFSAVGQYFQIAFGSRDLISVMRWFKRFLTTDPMQHDLTIKLYKN